MISGCLLCFAARRFFSHGGRTRTVPRIQANPIIVACCAEVGQTGPYPGEGFRDIDFDLADLKHKMRALTQRNLIVKERQAGLEKYFMRWVVARLPGGFSGKDHSCVVIEAPMKMWFLASAADPTTRMSGGFSRFIIDTETGFWVQCRTVQLIEGARTS